MSLYLSQATTEDLITRGAIRFSGDEAEAARLINPFDRYVPAKAFVVPAAAYSH